VILKILLLVGLLQLLYRTESPFLCSSIYGVAAIFLGLIFGGQILSVLIMSLIAFALATAYFWLLNEYRDGAAHRGIMIGGLVIGIV
jgi:hypothetical protein